MTKIATKADATFLNTLVADLKTTPALPKKLDHVIGHAIKDIAVEGFVTDKAIQEAWTKQTGKKPNSEMYRRFRAEVFLSLVCKELYHLDETKLVGTLGDTLRLLVAKNTTSIKEKGDFFAENGLGGPVTEVRVDIHNSRVVLRTNDASRGNNRIGDGTAEVRFWKGEGDAQGRWELHLPTGEWEPHKIDLSGTEIAKAQVDESILLPEEKAAMGFALVPPSTKDALKALYDLLTQYFALPKSDEHLVDIFDRTPIRDPKSNTLVMSLFATVCKSLKKPMPKIAPKELELAPVTTRDIRPETLQLVRSFRDGELNFLSGDYLTNIPTRAEGKKNTLAQIDAMVGWVVPGKLDTYSYQSFLKQDNVTKAWLLAHGDGDGLGTVKRTLAKDPPEGVLEFARAVESRGGRLISIAGPNVELPSRAASAIEQVKIDGKLAGYVVRVDVGYEEGPTKRESAAFDAKGVLLDRNS